MNTHLLHNDDRAILTILQERDGVTIVGISYELRMSYDSSLSGAWGT